MNYSTQIIYSLAHSFPTAQVENENNHRQRTLLRVWSRQPYKARDFCLEWSWRLLSPTKVAIVKWTSDQSTYVETLRRVGAKRNEGMIVEFQSMYLIEQVDVEVEEEEEAGGDGDGDGDGDEDEDVDEGEDEDEDEGEGKDKKQKKKKKGKFKNRLKLTYFCALNPSVPIEDIADNHVNEILESLMKILSDVQDLSKTGSKKETREYYNREKENVDSAWEFNKGNGSGNGSNAPNNNPPPLIKKSRISGNR